MTSTTMAKSADPPFDLKVAREKVYCAYKEVPVSSNAGKEVEVSFEGLVMPADEILRQAGEKPP